MDRESAADGRRHEVGSLDEHDSVHQKTEELLKAGLSKSNALPHNRDGEKMWEKREVRRAIVGDYSARGRIGVKSRGSVWRNGLLSGNILKASAVSSKCGRSGARVGWGLCWMQALFWFKAGSGDRALAVAILSLGKKK